MSRVTLILDPGFGEKLANLSHSQSIWIIESKANVAAAVQARKNSESDITTFAYNQATSAEEGLAEVLSTIDEHIAWNELEVVGLKINEQIRQILISGFKVERVQSTSQGFTLFRD